MTIFDTETDRYLEQLGTSPPRGDWNDVLERTRRARRRSLFARAAVGVGAVAATAAVALAVVGALGGPGGTSIVDKAEAAVLAPVQAAPGTIEHILVRYRTDSGEAFIEYETWIADDGAWCRRTVEGLPNEAVAATQLTTCGSPDGDYEVYLPSENEILRLRPGSRTEGDSKRADSGASGQVEGPRYFRVRETSDGKKVAEIVVKRNGKYYKLREVGTEAPSLEIPSASWFHEDVVEAFRRDAVREAGTMTRDGREYTKLVTKDGLNAVLVDPDTGEPVAWIPSPKAFGVPTTVIRSRETLPDDAEAKRNLSLTELHPDATVRDVSEAELAEAIAAQYPRG
ncbi:MAG: hypothetical protein ACRDLZ_07830 [Gaiellaceae bacterium]